VLLVEEVSQCVRFHYDLLLVGHRAKVVVVGKVMVPMLFVMKEICTICLGLAVHSGYL